MPPGGGTSAFNVKLGYAELLRGGELETWVAVSVH